MTAESEDDRGESNTAFSAVIPVVPSAVINHVERELRDILFVTDAVPLAVIPAKAGIHSSLCNYLS